MEQPENLHMNAQPAAALATAIDRWLEARGEYKKQSSAESEYRYNETYFSLGAAWTERYPDAANSPGAFEWFRRGLIAPEQ